MKKGQGRSCHHCKKRIPKSKAIKCGNDGSRTVIGNGNKKTKHCMKKYCLHCIKRFYAASYLVDHHHNNFTCPACNDDCRCASCRRKVMKSKLTVDGSCLINEGEIVDDGRLILESKQPEGKVIETGQIEEMLQILESRPDVQEIIRKGMSLDFLDTNAKVLYVAHLIDQALSRPDILALYYANSRGLKRSRKIDNLDRQTRKRRKLNHHDDHKMPKMLTDLQNFDFIESQPATNLLPNLPPNIPQPIPVTVGMMNPNGKQNRLAQLALNQNALSLHSHHMALNSAMMQAFPFANVKQDTKEISNDHKAL